jgi:hypothetical protein
MSLKSYIGFSTERSTFTEASDPTVRISSSFGGVSNMSLADYEYNRVPLYINANTEATSGGINVSSLAVNTPANSEGDLLLAFIASDSTSRTYSSTGWTVERSNTIGFSFSVLSKRATISEASSHTFTITGGSASTNAIMLCIKNCTSYVVGSFGAAADGQNITVPNDSGSRKLIIFAYGNIGGGKSWSIAEISESQIQLNNTDAPSLDVDAIYRTFSNTSLTYTVTQIGGGSNSYGISVVLI